MSYKQTVKMNAAIGMLEGIFIIFFINTSSHHVIYIKIKYSLFIIYFL